MLSRVVAATNHDWLIQMGRVVGLKKINDFFEKKTKKTGFYLFFFGLNWF